MRAFQIAGFAASLVFFTSLRNAIATSTSTFADLFDSLGNLSHYGKTATTLSALDHLTAADAGGPCARTVRPQRTLGNFSFTSNPPLTALVKVQISSNHPTQYNKPDRKPLLHPARSLILGGTASRDPASLPDTTRVRHRCIGLSAHHQILWLSLRREKWRPCQFCRCIEYPRRPHDRFSQPQSDTGIAGQDSDKRRSRQSLDQCIQSIG